MKNQHLRRAAYLAYNNALRGGRLVRPSTCSECGFKGGIEGHHHDYAEPLCVEWLCKSCHHAKHAVQIRQSTMTRPRCIACGRIVYRHLIKNGSVRPFPDGLAHEGQCARTAGVRRATQSRKEATANVA